MDLEEFLDEELKKKGKITLTLKLEEVEYKDFSGKPVIVEAVNVYYEGKLICEDIGTEIFGGIEIDDKMLKKLRR
ncbi:MAG: hypothetical protein ACTSV7_15020 [Candidatus Baldrarchaeia archaeon]